MNPNEYCNFEGDAFDYRAYAEAVDGSNAPVADIARSLAGEVDPAIVYTTLSEINSAIPIDEIDGDSFTEHVRLEADSYDADNYDDADSYDEDNFNSALRRRGIGQQAQTKMLRSLKALARKAKLTNRSEHDLFCGVLETTPEAIMQIRRYVIDRGYSPASTTRELCAQFAHARNEQIEEVANSYDADNFSFRSERRRKARQARRLQRIADRIARRKARKQGRLEVRAMGDEPEEQQAETHEAAKSLLPAEEKSLPTEMPSTEHLNPTTEQAEAEVLGSEFEGGYWGEGYDGDSDNFLPFLAGAFNLGKSVLSDVTEGRNPLSKGNWEQAKDLFRKKSKKKMQYDTTGGAKGIANRASKDVMAKIENQKAKEYAMRNAPLIAFGIVALLLIGSAMGK